VSSYCCIKSWIFAHRNRAKLMESEKIGNQKRPNWGLVAAGVAISDFVESMVALHHLPGDFLFLGVRSVELRGGFKLTTDV
jgi:hypothetical protein